MDSCPAVVGTGKELEHGTGKYAVSMTARGGHLKNGRKCYQIVVVTQFMFPLAHCSCMLICSSFCQISWGGIWREL